MDEKYVSILRKQLNDAASKLRPGPGGDKSVRGTISALIKVEEQSRQLLSSLSEVEVNDLLKYNGRLVETANRFLSQLLALPLTQEQQEQADQLQQRIQFAQEAMDARRSELAALNDSLARISADLEVQKAENDSIREQIKEKKTTYDSLTIDAENYRKDLETYSDEVIQAQRDANATLARQVADQQKSFRELEDQQRVLKDKLKAEQEKVQKQEEANTDLQNQIDAQPEALRKLEEAFSELDAKLARIQTAAEECSEEKQAELQAQIDELGPVVKALVKQHGELTAALEALNVSHETELAETAAAEEELLASMNAAVDALQEHCGALAEKLRTAMARSEQFEENLKLCRENYDRFHNWFRSDVPALTAMRDKAGLSDKEYKTLFETLDPARCDVIRTLMEETEMRLTRLDQILSDGIAAAQQDQSDTRYRAEVGEPPQNRS